jgi:hypothetical protein
VVEEAAEWRCGRGFAGLLMMLSGVAHRPTTPTDPPPAEGAERAHTHATNRSAFAELLDSVFWLESIEAPGLVLIVA